MIHKSLYMSKKCIVFDLDDTLYKEIEFVKSGYSYIASQLESFSTRENIYNQLLNSYLSGKNAFEELNKYLGIQKPIDEYLAMYRNHMPKITLSQGTANVLNWLIETNWNIGIMSDGRSITQRNKIKALGLHKYVEDSRILISEEFGSEKPSLANYQYFMKLHPDYRTFVYVGDNVNKDFLAPNRLGWHTVGIMDDGCNIHKRVDMPEEYQPQLWIPGIKNLITALSPLL